MHMFTDMTTYKWVCDGFRWRHLRNFSNDICECFVPFGVFNQLEGNWSFHEYSSSYFISEPNKKSTKPYHQPHCKQGKRTACRFPSIFSKNTILKMSYIISKILWKTFSKEEKICTCVRNFLHNFKFPELLEFVCKASGDPWMLGQEAVDLELHIDRGVSV